MAGKIENQIQTIELVKPKHLRCIVKLGGAAITRKDELETIHEENLRSVCRQLREAMMRNSASGVVGMDWSRRRDGDLPVVTEIDEDWALDLDNEFVVVHGAGSFGHFQASRSGVHKGDLRRPFVKAGFVATRISVTSLNLEIVRALAREGIPSVGLSPFANGWTTNRRNIASADISQVAQTLYAGFVPRVAPVCSVREPITEINDLPIGFLSCGAKVHEAQLLLPEQPPINNVKTSPSHAKVLHGDAVLDDCQDCTILSGDVIIRHLACQFLPEYVVFLTDVLGVYDRPPTDSSAVLLREIAVDEDGNWSIIKPMLEDSTKQVEITIAAHDTTGGMETKISEAAEIARLGIDVYITKAGTEHSLRALMGKVSSVPDDWLGTVIRSSKGNHPSK